MPDITSNLILYYRMDAVDISGTSLADASGNGNTGTLVNGPTSVAGKIGQALSFSGASQQLVTVPNSAGLNIVNNQMTVAAWVNSVASPGTYRAVVYKSNSTGSAGYAIYTGSTGTVRFFVGISSPKLTPDVASPWDGNWHHVVGTYDGSFLTMYVDGVPKSQVAQTGNIADSSTKSMGIAADPANPSVTRFTGSIDEVRIYSRALSAADVAALYAYNGSTPTGKLLSRRRRAAT